MDWKGVAMIGLILGAVAFSSPLRAEEMTGKYEISPFVGGYFFDDDAGLNHAPVFGLRAGRWLTRDWEAELSLDGLGTDGKDGGGSANFFQTHLDALYHFDLGYRFLPFLAAGVGGARYQGGDHGDTEWDLLVDYGAGVKYPLSDKWGLRLDLRQPITIGPPRFNFMATLGVSYLWGGAGAMAEEQRAAEQPGAGEMGAGQPRAGEAGAGQPGAGEVGAGQPRAGEAGAVSPGVPSMKAPSAPAAPPPRTGALEAAPEKPVEGGGLAGTPLPGFQRIHFDFDEYAITPQARPILDTSAELMRKDPGIRVRIEGHCDERGTDEYNMALGERRAKAALRYLEDQGIDPSRMSTVSYGSEQPLNPGHYEEAWAENRRDEFVKGE